MRVLSHGPRPLAFGIALLVTTVTAVPAAGHPPVEPGHGAMVDALDERLRRVETGLREIEGCSARRIGVDEAVRLLGEFWSGEPREYGDPARVIRTEPVIGGQP